MYKFDVRLSWRHPVQSSVQTGITYEISNKYRLGCTEVRHCYIAFHHLLNIFCFQVNSPDVDMWVPRVLVRLHMDFMNKR